MRHFIRKKATLLLKLLLLSPFLVVATRETVDEININFPQELIFQERYISPPKESYALFRGTTSAEEQLEMESCFRHTDCHNCSSALRCHWCAHDQKCHVVGSVKGCAFGMNCDRSDDNKKKDHNDSCAAFPNCTSCANTHTCHWCAHDNSCHTVGSIYGCVRGVDCFAEDRCRRQQPEPLARNQQHFTNMSSSLMILLAGIGSVAFLLATSCLCCACGIKGSYDDLMWCIVAYRNSSNSTNTDQINNIVSTSGDEVGATITTPLLEMETEISSSVSDDPEPPSNTPQETQHHHRAQTAESFVTALAIEAGTEDNRTDYQTIEEEHDEANYESPQQEMTPLRSTSNRAVESSSVTSESRQSSKHMRRFLTACTFFYVLVVALIGSVYLAAVRLYPKVPEYSVCNDNVQWKKLIDSMASLKAEVDFEILLSIENANHVQVALDMGRGNFQHSGATIGHYVVPPVVVPAMSITDIMVIATVAPEKWEALSLTREYYEGKLVLDINVDLNLRVPTFFNISKEVSLSDIPIKISREQDRHLCACRQWSDYDYGAARQHDIRAATTSWLP